MEIEVGEWVRTKAGVIAKVCAYQDLVTYDNKGISVTFHSFDTNKGAIADINIAKHSKNIIDLIEIGDIVECFVEEDVDGEDTIKYEVTATDILDTNGNKINEIGICGEEGPEFISFKNIRSILTHEQYKQNCYRLEE